MLTLLSLVVAVDYGKHAIGGKLPIDISGDAYPFDLDVAPKPVPVDARITIRGGRGDIIRPRLGRLRKFVSPARKMFMPGTKTTLHAAPPRFRRNRSKWRRLRNSSYWR